MTALKAEYINHMGDDLMVVNAARVSFEKESWWENEEDWLDFDEPLRLSERDAKLIQYLAKHNHWTPFAHPQITLRMTAPIFVRTQCFKHKQGFVENEVSRRYVDSEPEFYVPDAWRKRADNKKQGSADETVDVVMQSMGWDKDWPTSDVENCPINKHIRNTSEQEPCSPGTFYKYAMVDALHAYQDLLDAGVCPEQARMVLPQSMMTQWYWTGSLAAYARFFKQRTDPHAQKEIQELARMVGQEIEPLYPVSWKALTE